MQESWTIAELTELAAETLAATDSAEPSSGQARANGRVRDVPNERLVRWYVTVGLVDPPLGRRGRVARYGRRHLLQLVAVKRRQAEGRSLAEIQAELTGATDEMLAVVAHVPDAKPAPEPPTAAPDRFWTRQPTRLTPGTDTSFLDTCRPVGGRHDIGRPGRWMAGAAPLVGPSADTGTGIVHGVRLAAGVTLFVEGGDRELGPEDLGGIIDAAGPLLEELARRRLRVAGGQAIGASGAHGDLAEEGGQ
jgi:MerR HTH family regulatory protein